MFLKVLIYRDVAFTYANTQKDITQPKQDMPFAWVRAFNQNFSASAVDCGGHW